MPRLFLWVGLGLGALSFSLVGTALAVSRGQRAVPGAWVVVAAILGAGALALGIANYVDYRDKVDKPISELLGD